MKLTLGDARATIGRVMGVCSTDSRIPDILNEAVQRLISRGKWVGTTARYRICVNSGCITWPRQIETIESFAICDRPGIIRNEWFEFVQDGPGVMAHDENWGNLLIDRGTAISFDDFNGTNKKIRVYADVAESADAKLFVQYYDSNANWKRTLVSGSWVNGEYITISTTPQNSESHVLTGGWVGVQKPVTNGVVRVYEYDTVTGAQRPLAIYEPDETRPEYRRSMIPGLSDMPACDDSSTGCTSKAVTVMAKLKFIPVSADTDLLLIGNLPALKDMVQAILKRERNLLGEAAAYEVSAINELQQELASYQGSGPVPAIRVAEKAIWGGGAIDNLIPG